MKKFIAASLACCFWGCAYLLPPEYAPLVVRESFKPTDWHYEIVRVYREEDELQKFEAWLNDSAPEDIAASAAVLLLTGWNAAWPGSVFAYTLGADTYASWHLDPGIAATHYLTARLQNRRGIAYLSKPPYARPLGGPAPAGSTTPTILLRADLHVHSAFSHDSATPIRDILRTAHDRGIDVLSITDHDILAYPQALRVYHNMVAAGELRRPLILIPGVEVSSAEGHILGYFVHTPIPPGMDARATIAAIHSQGGLAVLAHPNRPEDGVNGALGRRLPVDGVEAINSAQIFPLAWRADHDEADEYSPNHYGNSDAHFAQWIGAVYTQMAVTEVSYIGVWDAMRAGRVEAKLGNRTMKGFAAALDAPGVKQVLQAANWPRRAWQRARAEAAQLLRVDDVYLISSWREIWLDAYRLNRLLELDNRLESRFDNIHAPPLPVEVGIRVAGARIYLKTPVANFGGVPKLTYPQLLAEELVHDHDVIIFDRREKNRFFVWPSELVGGVSWQWIF